MLISAACSLLSSTSSTSSLVYVEWLTLVDSSVRPPAEFAPNLYQGMIFVGTTSRS